MALKTNYVDDVFSGNRKYNLINNTDNTVSLEDATTYTTEGDVLNASAINGITTAINAVEGAQVNVIETVKVNGTTQTVTSKAVNISVPQIVEISQTNYDAGVTAGTIADGNGIIYLITS